MKMNKKIFALALFFATLNLNILHANWNDEFKAIRSSIQPTESATVTVNVTAEVITPEQAVFIFGNHVIQHPLELIKNLIANKCNNFIFTINNITYIVESTAQSNTTSQPAATNNAITTTIAAQPVSPETAAEIVAQAAALFLAENMTDTPLQFIKAMFDHSYNGFIFTIDAITYIIQS